MGGVRPTIGNRSGPSQSPTATEIIEAKNRLVRSPGFARSRRLIKLLEFTIDAAIDGRAGDIKEYTIGADVYERGADFDPRADGIVRVEANRLRQKLAEYYEGAGLDERIRVQYPKGAYVPEFYYADPAADSVAPALLPEPVTGPVKRRPTIWLAAVAATALVCALFGYLLPHRTRASSRLFVRPGVAVLSPVNLSGNPADNWLSAALRELLASELAASGKLRLPPGEMVARSERELTHVQPGGFAPDTLADLTRMLNVETVLTGHYVVAGGPNSRQIRVDLRLQRPGAISEDVFSETGTPEKLLELTSRLGARLRERMGMREAVPMVAAGSPGAAAQSYYSGLERFRAYDPLGALAFLDRAIQVAPNQPMPQLLRARCLELLGRDPEAGAAIASAMASRQLRPRDEQLQIEAFSARLNHNSGQEAAAWRALSTFYPDELEYRFRLVLALADGGHYQDAVAEIAAMRSLPAPLNRDARIDWADMKTAFKQTDFARRLDAARKLEEKARAAGSEWLRAEAMVAEVTPLVRANRTPEASRALHESRAIYQRLGDRAGEAFTYRNEGTMLAGNGDAAGALAAFSRELAIAEQIGNLIETGNAWNAIGVMRRILGDLPGSRDALQRSLSIAYQRQSPMDIKMATLNLADVSLCLGDAAGAERMFASALEVAHGLGETEGETKSLIGKGYAQLVAGRDELALSSFEAATEIARRASDNELLAESAVGVADASLLSHRVDLARAATADARRLAEISGDAYVRIESHLTAARLAIEERRFSDAETELREAKPIVDKDHDVDLSTRWATLLTEDALAQRHAPGPELDQLRRIPAGTPTTSALEAKIVLARATRGDPAPTLAEAHRLGLIVVEQRARALKAL